MVVIWIPTKPVKSLYKYRIISSVILSKFPKSISIDICMDFQLIDAFALIAREIEIKKKDKNNFGKVESAFATVQTSLTNSMTLTKANLIVKRISLDISLTNVMTLTRCWVIFHITSTTMLSHAICLCAITSTIMAMFSVDKSFANNTEKGLFGGLFCCYCVF